MTEFRAPHAVCFILFHIDRIVGFISGSFIQIKGDGRRRRRPEMKYGFSVLIDAAKFNVGRRRVRLRCFYCNFCTVYGSLAAEIGIFYDKRIGNAGIFCKDDRNVPRHVVHRIRRRKRIVRFCNGIRLAFLCNDRKTGRAAVNRKSVLTGKREFDSIECGKFGGHNRRFILRRRIRCRIP